jgi:hypothetical protein
MPRAKGLSELMEALKASPQAAGSMPSTPKETPKGPMPSAPTAKGSMPTTATVSPAKGSMPSTPTSQLFGSPAIHRPTNALRSVNLDEEQHTSGKIEGGLALAAQAQEDIQPEPEPEVELKELFLHDIRAAWADYIEEVKKTCKMSISHSVIRSQVVSVKGELLTLECDDEFTRNILQVNQRDLMVCWKSVLGRMLTLEFTLNAARPKAVQDDPYSRFRKLQQEDPKLKMIVDVFGAELDY